MNGVSTAKLSRLQRTILTIAYRNRIAEGRTGDSAGADCYYAEVLVEHFGLPARPYGHTGDPPRYSGIPELRRRPGLQRFSRTKIGAKRYDAAQAALSRAAVRLETRGLVVIVQGAVSRWSGVDLTAGGLDAAATIRHRADAQTVESQVKCPESQPLDGLLLAGRPI